MSGGYIMATMSVNDPNLPETFHIALQLDENGRLRADNVRKALQLLTNAKRVNVGQMYGVVLDGTRVVDIRDEKVFADKDGLNYKITDVIHRLYKEFEDFEHFQLAGPENIHIIGYIYKD